MLHPGDDGDAEARTLWNAWFDKYPSVIVRCPGAADVITAVDFAREHDLPLAVTGGGHDYGSDAVRGDGLLMDRSPMDAVRVDTDAELARVEPAAMWPDVDREAQADGLATTGTV